MKLLRRFQTLSEKAPFFRAGAALRSLIGLSAIACCFPGHPAGAQGLERTERKQFDLTDLPVLKNFVPTAGEYYNKKAQTFWYKGTAGYLVQRYSYGFSEVNYSVLRFSSRRAMKDWDARFDRIGIRSDWRAGVVFRGTPKR
jgi:hypothetical protein